MGKKIGILTFHNADNLGAVLQTFALQNTLEKKCDAQVEVIDYRCEAVEKTKYVKKCVSIKDIIKFIPMNVYYGIKRNGFSKFRKKFLNLSRQYDSTNIKDCSDFYDIFITGSDQIWNPGCSGEDYTYFLDFLNTTAKKVSYAASIGPHIYTDEEKNKVISLIDKYDYVSVREQSGAKQLNNLGINNVLVHPDPVTLLNCEEWKPYMSKRICSSKYILVYLILPDVNVTKAAEDYAKKNGCKIINNKKSIEFILNNSPSDFLSWVYNAECVFTNSFHGTAFSLIFNKKLGADISIIDKGVNNRVNDFLERTNSTQCIISSDKLSPAIPNAVETLDTMKQDALEYIKTICS